MASCLRSVQDSMTIQAAQGDWDVAWNARTTPTATAGNATSGYQSVIRWSATIVVPSMGAGVAGCYAKVIRPMNATIGQTLVSWDTMMGSLAFTGGAGTFTGGTAMPSRRVSGQPSAIQLASSYPILYVSTTVAGAVTPTITITYTNQAGTGSRTATLVTPSNPLVGSCFLITPHLQSGDTGIRSVQNITTSGGSSGVMRVMGVMPLEWMAQNTNLGFSNVNTMMPLVQPLLATNDEIATYRIGSVSSGAVFVHAVFGAETT